jgi:hypothetical protein
LNPSRVIAPHSRLPRVKRTRPRPQPDGTIGVEQLPATWRSGIEVFDGDVAGARQGVAGLRLGAVAARRLARATQAGWDTLREAFTESVR